MTSQLQPLPQQVAQDFQNVKGIHGEFLLQSIGMFVIRGLEDYRFLIKACPRPILTEGDPARTKCAGGVEIVTRAQPENVYEGQLSIIETEGGAVNVLADWIAQREGGEIDADFYVGTPDNYTQVHELLACAIRFEPSDFDTDSRSEGVVISAPITYHYFGSNVKIGSNYTVQSGKKEAKGVAGLVSRVNNAMSKVRQVANGVSGVANGVGAISSSLGSMFK